MEWIESRNGREFTLAGLNGTVTLSVHHWVGAGDAWFVTSKPFGPDVCGLKSMYIKDAKREAVKVVRLHLKELRSRLIQCDKLLKSMWLHHRLVATVITPVCQFRAGLCTKEKSKCTRRLKTIAAINRSLWYFRIPAQHAERSA
jgi:hypothetical protein